MKVHVSIVTLLLLFLPACSYETDEIYFKEIPPPQREKVLIAGQAGYHMAARRLEQARAAAAAMRAHNQAQEAAQ